MRLRCEVTRRHANVTRVSSLAVEVCSIAAEGCSLAAGALHDGIGDWDYGATQDTDAVRWRSGFEPNPPSISSPNDEGEQLLAANGEDPGRVVALQRHTY